MTRCFCTASGISTPSAAFGRDYLLVLKNIKDPLMVKELIHNQVEEMKIQRRVLFGEIATTDMGGDDDLDDLDS